MNTNWMIYWMMSVYHIGSIWIYNMDILCLIINTTQIFRLKMWLVHCFHTEIFNPRGDYFTTEHDDQPSQKMATPWPQKSQKMVDFHGERLKKQMLFICLAGWWFGTWLLYMLLWLSICWECQYPIWASYFSRWYNVAPPSYKLV